MKKRFEPFDNPKKNPMSSICLMLSDVCLKSTLLRQNLDHAEP